MVSHWRYWRWRSLVKPPWFDIGFPLAILALAIRSVGSGAAWRRLRHPKFVRREREKEQEGRKEREKRGERKEIRERKLRGRRGRETVVLQVQNTPLELSKTIKDTEGRKMPTGDRMAAVAAPKICREGEREKKEERWRKEKRRRKKREERRKERERRGEERRGEERRGEERRGEERRGEERRGEERRGEERRGEERRGRGRGTDVLWDGAKHPPGTVN